MLSRLSRCLSPAKRQLQFLRSWPVPLCLLRSCSPTGDSRCRTLGSLFLGSASSQRSVHNWPWSLVRFGYLSPDVSMDKTLFAERTPIVICQPALLTKTKKTEAVSDFGFCHFTNWALLVYFLSPDRTSIILSGVGRSLNLSARWTNCTMPSLSITNVAGRLLSSVWIRIWNATP